MNTVSRPTVGRDGRHAVRPADPGVVVALIGCGGVAGDVGCPVPGKPGAVRCASFFLSPVECQFVFKPGVPLFF